jgi:hypothetical protein
MESLGQSKPQRLQRQPIDHTFTIVQAQGDATAPVQKKVTSTHWGANIEAGLADQSNLLLPERPRMLAILNLKPPKRKNQSSQFQSSDLRIQQKLSNS